MDAELDYDLTLEQWETLRALRIPPRERRALNHSAIEELIAEHVGFVQGVGWLTLEDLRWDESDGPQRGRLATHFRNSTVISLGAALMRQM